MTGPPIPSLTPDAGGVAANRLRFLTDDGRPERVRPLILASWRRSRNFSVAPDSLELPYRADLQIDTPLVRSAQPVLARLAEQLSGQPISIVLTDAAGLVLSRRSGTAELERYLDSVRLAPGFNYAEEFVGTNGIGTALEAGSAAEVFGHEHYAEDLERLACAGVPIHDPISGRLLGVIDLTCWRKDAESLLLTLATSTADQIKHALVESSSAREFEVLRAYRQTCRRTNGIVFAVTNDAMMLNSYAQAELDPADQAALQTMAGETASSALAGRRHSLSLVLPSGAAAQLYCQQVDYDGAPAGLVVHVKLVQDAGAPTGMADASMSVPGLVGDTSSWRRVCRQVQEAMNARSWLMLEGEVGTGKVALLRGVQVRRQPPARSVVLDAADVGPGWMDEARRAVAANDTVIFAHVDQLNPARVRALHALLDDTRRDPERRDLWVAATCRPGAGDDALARLMPFFPTTLAVPPLRLHIDDLPGLVTFFLGKLGSGGNVQLAPAALRVLMRSPWPGNVRQLQQLVHDLLQHRRSGVVGVEDLPPEMHSISRRVLSTLEQMERDAIVRSLTDARGNKVQAARSLGMSRATIYRKIHEFGIVL
ncbi:sigma-54-dependent Fis family transcriptional regulator [uncultured Jatrophihabitans sp.]|uniref:sigma-54-dependent Fis family transcriptional regulator n=1 Tax=uncultured Jatrophihabitans sp. TaxID=1610747 RepID=UPI0035CB8A0C